MGNEKSFAFFVCVESREDYELIKANLDEMFCPAGYQVFIIWVKADVYNSSAYNNVMQKNNSKYKIYIHAGVQIVNANFLNDILDVFSDMTHLLALDKKDLILTIVNSVFEGIDVSKNYIIRACHEEAAFLKENRKKIVSGVSDVSIEIVEDLSMKRGQCIIDTDVGVFDCSLDIQMEELMADIKMISCAGKRT